MYEGDPFEGGDPKYEQPLYVTIQNIQFLIFSSLLTIGAFDSWMNRYYHMFPWKCLSPCHCNVFRCSDEAIMEYRVTHLLRK